MLLKPKKLFLGPEISAFFSFSVLVQMFEMHLAATPTAAGSSKRAASKQHGQRTEQQEKTSNTDHRKEPRHDGADAFMAWSILPKASGRLNQARWSASGGRAASIRKAGKGPNGAIGRTLAMHPPDRFATVSEPGSSRSAHSIYAGARAKDSQEKYVGRPTPGQ